VGGARSKKVDKERNVVTQRNDERRRGSKRIKKHTYKARGKQHTVQPTIHGLALNQEMATMAPLSLYRSLLRQGKLIKDYNFRSYAIRRVKTGFQENRGLQGCVRLLLLRWIGNAVATMNFCCASEHYSTLLLSIIFLTDRPTIHYYREEAAAALKDGEQQLKMLHRQATISQLYPSARSVME